MKIKNIVTVLLVAFILVSCAPAAKVVPTETTIPTSTFTPVPPTPTITLTPTITPTITPEPKVFVIAHSKSEALKTCNISESEINQWIDYSKLNDGSGDFSNKVIFWQLVESAQVFGYGNGSSVYWGGNEQNANPRTLFNDPETWQTRRVAFCTLEGQSIRLIKFINPSGKISWYVLRTVSMDDSISAGEDFPAIEWKIPLFEGFNDPFVQAELRKWLETFGQDDFPSSLENKVLTTLN